MTLTPAERTLAFAIEFEADICEKVKQETNRPLSRLMAFSDEYETVEVNGLSVEVERQDVEHIVTKLRLMLVPRGYIAFWSEKFENNGLKESDEIAILKTTDQFSIIAIRQSNGANYGASTGDVVAKLKQWEERSQFDVIGASADWVALRFSRLPDNICAFAEEVYSFCLDTVEQGVGLMQESEEPETFEAARCLCPSLSPEMQSKLEERNRKFQEMEMPLELRRALERATGFNTSTEMGIRLLALHLQRTGELFLWWD